MQKRILLLVSLLTFTICSFAQLSISTSMREDGIWDSANSKWVIISKDSSGTFLEFNKELTMFKHTTTTITSNYKITSYEYDEEEVAYTMQVVSDVGNEYELIIDGLNEVVIFFYFDDKEEYAMVRHSMKKTWFKE